MQVLGWKSEHANAASGAGYGILLSRVDRDTYFQRNWKAIQLELEGEPHTVEIKLTKLLWHRNLYIHHAAIGKWLIRHGYENWPQDNPPVMQLTLIKDNLFKLALPHTTA